MSPAPRNLQRLAAERRLVLAERLIEDAMVRAVGSWLATVRDTLIAELAPAGLTAAGYGEVERAAEAAKNWNAWRHELDNTLLPAVAIAFGEQFQDARRRAGNGSLPHQQDYLAQVADRLRIWPEGAFERLRPELLEALAEAETIEQITDRVGWVLGIDADQRAIKAMINEVEAELEQPDLTPERRADLRARRRRLWQDHDDEETRWRWLARRIARTEAHGAVMAGQLAAAREREAEHGITLYKRWLATEDTRTRASHRVADGQTVPLAQPFRVGGFLLQFPGDPIVIAPHETINCRCSLLILDGDELQDELQGPDGSLGEVKPGGVRVGTDDPDEAEAAIHDVVEAEQLQPPPDPADRGERHGQPTPPDGPHIEWRDERDEPVWREPDPADVDLSGYSDDELFQLMVDNADGFDGMYEAARNEWDRRALELDRPPSDTDTEEIDLGLLNDADLVAQQTNAPTSAGQEEWETRVEVIDSKIVDDDVFDRLADDAPSDYRTRRSAALTEVTAIEASDPNAFDPVQSPEHDRGIPPIVLSAIPDLKLDRADVEKIIYGVPDNKAGGHLFGVTRPGKSETPRAWTPARFLLALLLLTVGYHYEAFSGDRRVRRLEVNGVIFELSTYMQGGKTKFRSFFALNGAGVYKIDRATGRRVPVPLDRRLLYRDDL